MAAANFSGVKHMDDQIPEYVLSHLDDAANEAKKQEALRSRCAYFRQRLMQRVFNELAALAAMSLQKNSCGELVLVGEHLLQTYTIKKADFSVSDAKGVPAPLTKELLWLHYLDRADGHPLTGKWVNLSQIGGLFYQQAFQGYCGDELAESWKDDIEGLRRSCLATGGWELQGPGDLAFEWRILPRLPLLLSYRLPVENKPAWATLLFDAAANHYVAADVAAICGKELADSLKPTVSS